MLRNYIITAFRNFRKYKGYTFINVLGLTVGLTSSFLILLWITDEVSIDKFHEHDARLYQMLRNMHLAGGEILTTDAIPQPVKGLLESEYAEVDKVSLVSWELELLLQKDETTFREKGRYVSPQFFEIFSFPFIAGDRSTALSEIHSIVISEDLAKKYFKTLDQAVGQTLRVNNEQDFTVMGIFKNPGTRSSLQFDWVIPADEYILQNDWVESWYNGGFSIFFTLKENADVHTFRKTVEQEINNHTRHEADERLVIQKFSDRYLHSTFANGVSTGGQIDYVNVLTIVAIFIVVIACVNFMNLATARSARRVQEIGLRKVIGAGKAALGIQFLTESIVVSFVSVLISVLLAYLILPYFNNLTGKLLMIDFAYPPLWITIIGLGFITGLLSGSYPALWMPSFRITHALKGLMKYSAGAMFFRKGLVVFQFGISILLLVGTITVYKQMDYIMSKNLGLDKENIVFIEMEGDLGKRLLTFTSELMKIPEVQNVTSTSGNPLSYGRSSSSPSWKGKKPDEEVEMNILMVGPDFMKTMKTQLLEGRDFLNESDSANYIINEEALGIMGFENPIGEPLSVWGVDGQIIGVIKNFHMSSLYEPIAPLIIRYDPGNTSMAFIRIRGNTQQALTSIEKLTTRLNPAYPFAYHFLDEEYAKTYQSERVISTLSGIFSLMAIIVSCLGLLGLSSFSVERRIKEIGIRKIHGAKVSGLVLLLSREYTLLIFFAFLASAPLAYYFTNNWLDRFTFRTELGVLEFFIAGLSTLTIVALTVGFKSYRAAHANPVDSLKEE